MSIRKGQVIVAGAGNSRRNIGEVYYSQSSLATDNSGALPLFTGESIASANIIYPEFYAWVERHTELQCTAEEYESALTTYGECPKYVLSADSLRLPKLANYIKMANGIDGITQSLEGLPDHTHTTYYKLETSGDTNAQPCWRNEQQVQTGPASESNPIYGRSEHVTPAHTTLFPWVTAYTASIEASVAQTAEFQQGLSGKVDLPAGVTNDNVDYVVESYNDDNGNWYRLHKSGWLEQGGFLTCTDGAQTNITFLKPFADTNYIWTQGQMTVKFSNAQFFNGWGLTSYTETGMVVRNATNGTDKVAWYVCGKGA